jgi:hypothetical protein
MVSFAAFFAALEIAYVGIVALLSEAKPAVRATIMAMAVTSSYFGRAVIAPLTPFIYMGGGRSICIAMLGLCGSALLALRWVNVTNIESTLHLTTNGRTTPD